MKYHWKIISLIIHLKINEYLLKYFHWHLSDIELSLQSVSSILLKFQRRARTFKCLWGPGIDSKEWIPPAYVVWRAGTKTLFLLGA